MDAALTELELDALRELMNTGVGKSARSLSELLGRPVVLSVPFVGALDGPGAGEFFSREFKREASYASAAQDFNGPLAGRGLFVLSNDECSSIASLIGLAPEMTEGVVVDLVEELCNLVLVSCVGFIAGALGAKAQFSSPNFTGRWDAGAFDCASFTTVGSEDAPRLGLRTSFRFKDSEADGHLLLAISGRSGSWLRAGLASYIEGLLCSTT